MNPQSKIRKMRKELRNREVEKAAKQYLRQQAQELIAAFNQSRRIVNKKRARRVTGEIQG